MRICPVCGRDAFVAYGHVVQEWLMDKSGLCVDVLNDCVSVTHEPDNEDIWECYYCGYKARGEKFYVQDLPVLGGDSIGIIT